MLNYSTIEERERSELLLEMENDAELQAFISNGWPDKRSRLARNLQSYWNYHDECRTIKQGMVIVNTWVFILRRYKWHIHAGSWSLVNCLAGSLDEALYRVLMNICKVIRIGKRVQPDISKARQQVNIDRPA